MEKARIKIALGILFAASAIAFGVGRLSHPDTQAFELPPTIMPATVVPIGHEPFKKEFVLANLHTHDGAHYLPDDRTSLPEFEPRHLDYRVKAANYDYPWSMDFLPGGDLLIAIHHGALLHYNSATHQVSEIAGLPTDIASGSYQLGLLDLAVDPDFVHNHQIFLSFTASRKNADNVTEYATCVTSGTLFIPEATLKLYKRFCAGPWDDNPTQFGGALALDSDDHLLLTVGDRSWRNAAQNIHITWGKILRLSRRRLSPSITNPFVQNRAIWSIGHRNPQGLYYDKTSDLLYESEHGPKGGDEINIIRRGLNYGWPVISYGHEYDTDAPVGEGTAKPGFIQPLYYYAPSIATSALIVYQGSMFPEWRGSLLVTSLKGYHLNRLSLRNGKVVAEERYLGYLQSRLRDVKEAPDGSIYILSEDGFILRLFR